MNKAKLIIDKLLLTLAGLALIVMVILSIYQVAARFIFNAPSTMSEEIVRFLLIWFALLSASYVFGVKKTYRYFVCQRIVTFKSATRNGENRGYRYYINCLSLDDLGRLRSSSSYLEPNSTINWNVNGDNVQCFTSIWCVRDFLLYLQFTR